jgi:hypothetical protein
MVIAKTEKIEEGKYLATSPNCPECGEAITVPLGSYNLFRYNQGAFATEVFPELSADDRERFISGYCSPCWDKAFPEEEED